MTTGLIMVGAVVANHSQYSLDDTTPLVRLTSDYEVVVVPKNSQLTRLSDVAEAMKGNLRSVSIAGGSAGGAEQILAGLMAKAVGANPAQLSYVAHSGGGEMLSTLLSGRSTIAISGVSEIQPQIESVKFARSPFPVHNAWRDCLMCRRCAKPAWTSSCRTGEAS